MKGTMSHRAATFLSTWLFALWLGGTVVAQAEPWSLHDGRGLPGEPTLFDPERKTVHFRDPISEREAIVPTEELSLRSRQKLLLSPVFHRSGGEGWLQSPAKRWVATKAAGIVALAMGLGFWVAGWSCAGKWNPLLAGIGFVGTWVLVGILVAFYTFLKARIEGGAGIVALGTAATLTVASLYVSAVYACSYWRGLLALLVHPVAGVCLLVAGLAAMEATVGTEQAEIWWNAQVFEPAGLIPPQEPEARTGP